MDLPTVLTHIQHFADVATNVLGSLVLLGTAVVRLTPTKKDDEFVTSIGGKMWAIFAWLPTIGINPQTAALKAAYDDAQAKLELPVAEEPKAG